MNADILNADISECQIDEEHMNTNEEAQILFSDYIKSGDMRHGRTDRRKINLTLVTFIGT